MTKNKVICSLLIVLIFVSLFALPLNTKAKTIKEFEEEAEKYTKQLQEKQANLAKKRWNPFKRKLIKAIKK